MEDRKYRVQVDPKDTCFMEVDLDARRIFIHLTTTPTRSVFLRRWRLLSDEVHKMDAEHDLPIDLMFDYSEAAPLLPSLKIVLFTKTLGMSMGFPNVNIWRIVPGDPKKNVFLQQVLEAVPQPWLGTIRVAPRSFPNRAALEKHLDEFREGNHKRSGEWHWKPPK